MAHLREHKFNWISFVDALKTDETWITPPDLTDFASQLPHMITSGELELFKESYQIYLDKQQDDARTNIKSKDDEIISKFEEENPEEWVGVDDLLHGPGKSLLQKKIQAVRLKRRREVAKKIAEERLLSRRSKHVGTICRTFPDIGKEIEAFVLYRGLDVIQYTDGNDKLVLNRDDLSVFPLDSMVTHNKAGTRQIKGLPTLTLPDVFIV